MGICRTLNQVLLASCVCVALFATAPVAWSLSLTTTAIPSVTLSTSSVTLSDSADLTGGTTLQYQLRGAINA